MIIKRMAEAIRAQNWFTVIIEILIVVIGIFLGLQVTEWNDDRQNDVLAVDYLRRLHVDMTLSIQGTEWTKAFISSNIPRLNMVLDSLEACTLAEEDRDDFANGLNQAGKLIPATFVTGTVDELRASGRIGLLKSPNIRDLLNEAGREMDYQASVWPSLHSRVRIAATHIDENAVIRRKGEGKHSGLSAATWDELSIDFEAMCRDRKFYAAVVIQERLAYVNIDWLNRNLENFREVQQALAAELGLEPNEEATP